MADPIPDRMHTLVLSEYREDIADTANSIEVVVRVLCQKTEQQGQVDFCGEAAQRTAGPEKSRF